MWTSTTFSISKNRKADFLEFKDDMTLKAVFFDLDGTLLDTSDDLADALNRLLLEQGRAPLAYERIRQEVSNGGTAMVKLGFGTLPEAELQPLRQRLLDLYHTNIAVHTKAFPGITELIQRLAQLGIAWGIVTNKPKLYTGALMQHFHFAAPPAAIVSPDHVGVGKPNPAALLHACQLAACLPNEAIYIGDHLRDIECGHNAGMPTIAVGYGFTQDPHEHRHWNATHVADRVVDIWPILSTYL
jgi:2-phosphoglycolate phosphatase